MNPPEKEEQSKALLQMEKLAAIGRLVAGFSHEVRSPLTVILGETSLLEADNRDPRMRESIERIRQATKRIETLVKNLLSYSRASKTTIGPIDLCALVDTTLELARLEEKWRLVPVAKQYDRNAPWTAGNVNTIMQVFLNLIINALQAMDGRKDANLRLEIKSLEGGRFVEVEVADNGPGIPLEQHSKIFEPFYTTKGKEGTGLGLSIVKEIVESHRGRIELFSSPGAGARFKVAFPAEGAPR